MGRKACGAFLLSLILSVPAANAEPFQTREQNPFTLVYGQPLPTPARIPTAGKLNYTASLDVANTVNIEVKGSESLYVDFESYQLSLGGVYSLNDKWALKLDVPFIYRGSGVFDHAIDEWHELLGLPEGDRPLVAEDQFNIFYDANGITSYNLSSSKSGIADSQLGIGYSLHQDEQSALSIWASIDMPTGDNTRLTGNDDFDYAFWLAGSYNLGDRSSAYANLGAVLPGDSVLTDLETESAVLYGYAGAQFAFNPTIAVKLQLGAHSGYYENTSLEFLGETLLLTLGATFTTSNCSALDIGLSEDVKVDASPDVSLLLSWKSTFGEC